jgi:hypothetical protein
LAPADRSREQGPGLAHKAHKISKGAEKVEQGKKLQKTRELRRRHGRLLQLDQAQDVRQLTEEEIQTRKSAKKQNPSTSSGQENKAQTEISLNLDQGGRCKHQAIPPKSQCQEPQESYPIPPA